MHFENLRVKRIVVHEVFQRADDRSIRAPEFAEGLEQLSQEAMGAFRLRMTEALSGESQSLQMQISKYGEGSFLSIAEKLSSASDEDFLKESRIVVNKLAEAQMARRIPGGMLIVFDGTVGSQSVPFVGVIKAETQAGFRRSHDGKHAVIEFLKNIFLTPATRLYKIGLLLLEDISKSRPDGRRVFVFDSNISVSNREAAAVYFYEGFLGCSLPSDGPYETARFFDLTKEYIRKSELDPDKKKNVIDSLYVFVRDEQDPTFTVNQFGERFLPLNMRDGYADFMQSRKFSANAVVRDTSQMGRRLYRRRLNFGSDIELSATPEALATKVKMEAIEGEEIDGIRPRWTKITVRESLTGEK